MDEWLESLTANAEGATVMGLIQASSGPVESEGWQMKQCWIQYIEKKDKTIPLLRKVSHSNKERTCTGNWLCDADPQWYNSHLTCLCIFQVEKRRRHQKHSKARPAGSSASFSAPRNASLSGSGLPATDGSCSIVEGNCVARSSALSAYENTDGLSVCGSRRVSFYNQRL